MRDADTTAPSRKIDQEADAAATVELLDQAAQSLFWLGRIFSRQQLSQLLSDPGNRSIELSRILVVQAVEASIQDDAGGEVSVGQVARALDIDPSTASRLVAGAIQDGFLARTRSARDSRSVILSLTDAGKTLADQARQFQRRIFEQATRDWPVEQRQEFARLFIQFADSVAEMLPRVSNTESR